MALSRHMHNRKALRAMGEVKTPCASPTTDIKNELYEALGVVVVVVEESVAV